MKISEFIKTLLGYEKIKINDFRIETEEYQGEKIFVATIELYKNEQYRCPICDEKCGKYGYQKNRTKRWRSLDISKFKFYIECEAPRCICPEHGVKTAKIPWAFPDSDYTYAFDMQVAYCAAMQATNFVARRYRIKWGTVGNCVKRVQSNVPLFKPNNFSNLKKIAIDEVKYKKGYKYITTVQNLETGEIVWANDGFGDEVLKKFFELLSEEERSSILYVVADGAQWITRQVEKYCPKAIRCIDPFHVVSWGNEALDSVRKRLYSDTKKTICLAEKP
jgi:transposase